MTWIFSAPFPAWRGRMMDEPAAASWQIGEFWQMFDARSVLHLKGSSAFQVLPSSPWSLGIQLSGGQQIYGKIIRAPSNPCFPNFIMWCKQNAGQNAGQKLGITKWMFKKLDIRDDGMTTAVWYCFSRHLLSGDGAFYYVFNLFLQPVHFWHLTAWGICLVMEFSVGFLILWIIKHKANRKQGFLGLNPQHGTNLISRNH